MLSSNSATLKQTLHADLKLVPRAKTSWALDILRAFEGLRGCDTYTQAFLQGIPICYSDFTVKTCLCALSEESTLSFSSLSANPFLWRPLTFHMPCLVRLSLIFFLNGKIDSTISFRTLWTIFWLAKTSNKPISLTTWLAVNPLNL